MIKFIQENKELVRIIFWEVEDEGRNYRGRDRASYRTSG